MTDNTPTSTSRNPTPTYESEITYGDKDLYARIAKTASQEGARRKVEEFDIPIRSGKAWTLQSTQICRISTPYGPQVGDLNIFAPQNTDSRGAPEHFWAARTRQLHASHVSVGDRLWSNLPWLRPLVTIVGDSLEGYGVDEVGGRVHDLLGTRCDPYVNKLLTSASYPNHCHSNLTRAIHPFGLLESDVHDVLNLFQVTGLNREGKYFMEASPATAASAPSISSTSPSSENTPATHIDLFAETSLLLALSTCPGGDLSIYGWGPDAQARMLETCRPLRVEIYDLVDVSVGANIIRREEVLKGWVESRGVERWE